MTSPNCVSTHHSAPSARRQRSAIVLTAATALVFAGGLATAVVPPKPADPPTALAAPLAVEPLALPAAATAQAPQVLPAASRASSEDGSAIIVDGGIKVEVTKTFFQMDTYFNAGISFSISLVNDDATFSRYSGTPARSGDVSVSYRVLGGSLGSRWDMAAGSPVAGTLTVPAGQTRSPSETIDITAGWTENLSLTGSRWLGGRQLFIQISDPIGAPILAWPKDVPTNTIDFDEHGGLVPVTLSQDYDIAKYMPNGDPEYATKYSPEARANPQSSTPYRLQVYDESNIYTFGRCTPDACWANDLTTKPSSAPYISAGLFPVAIDPDTMTRWGYDGLTPSGEIDVVMEFGILARTRRDASDTCEIAVAPYSVNESQQLAPAQLTYFAGTAVKTDITPAGDQDHCQVENITTVFTIPARHKMIGLSMPLGGPVKIDNLIRASMRITPWESIRPYVTSVTTPDLSSDAFTGGTTVPITVNFSEPVYLTDRNPVSWPGISPRLRLSPTSSTTYPLSPGPSEYTPHALYTPNAWDSTHTYYLTLPEDAAPADFSDAVIEFPDSPAATIKDLFGNTLDSTKGNRRVSFKAKLDPMRSFGALARADDPPAASANDTVKVRLSTEGGVESYRWLTQASEWTRTPQGAYEMNNLVLRAVGSAVDYPLTMGGQGQDQGSFYTADIPARDIVGGTETYVIMWRASSNDPWRFVPTVRPLKVPTSWTSVPVTQAALDEALYPVAGTYYQGDIEAWLAAVVGPADNNATVEWASSDPSVATIAAGTPGADKTRWPARVTFAGRAGKVSFTAKVDNSSTSTFATLKTPEFAVQVGSSDPAVSFVSVQRRLLASRNLPLLVSWSDNVRPRDPAAQFLIEVFEGDYATPDQIPANAPRVYSRVVTGVGAATVPAGALTALSSGGRPAYTARVQITSTTVPGPRSGDVAQILVVPANATVALARLDRYSITDATPSVPISWDVSNNIAGHTELKVTAKRGATVLWTVTDPATATANLPVLAIPANQVKEVYTVEAEVRNDSDPEGYLGKDSAVIEVYREDSLTLQVDGQDVPTAKLGLDYQDGMSVEEIRQSSPSAGLTVNYADFNDSIGTVNDRMRWATSDAATAAIGHKSNTSYTSIADLGYETYSPYDRMLLAGLGDGTASIQVTHAATGLTDTLDVDVQTLKDKLYLFSFDKSRPFTLTWTNGNGRTTTKTFGADGTAVIYEESGIASAVRAIWRDESGPTPTTWKASTANANLISGAGNPLRNEPFTLNVAATRALPNLPIALKDENGNPYTKPVVWRGAAYRNGQLCADTVEANLNSIPTAPDQSGQLLVAFDEQEMTDGGNDRLGVDDVIELMVEVTPVDTAYWPVIASVVTSDPGNIRGQLGSGAVSMAKRPAGPALPHIVLARFDTGDPAVPVQTIGPETAYLGPADAYPHPTLTTLVSLAGTGLTPTFGEIEAKTSIGAAAQVPAGQTSTVLDYAFTQNPYLEITSSLTDANLSGAAVGPGTTATAAARVFAAGRTAPVTAVALSFGLSNMVGVVAPDRDPVLHDRAQETSDAVEDIIRGEGSDGVNFKSELLDVAMDVMHSTSLNLSIVRLDFDLYATSDPTVYQGVIRANASWAGDGEADIAFDYNGVEVEFKLVPSAAEIVDVVETMLDPSSLLSPFDLYKNFGSRIAYNVELHWTPGQTKGSSGSWDMVLTSGQATLFGELGFHVSANMPLFFVVPLTFAVDGTLGIEAGGRVALPTSVFTPNAQKRWPITDLFGTWNVYGGIGAFVGLGFESKIATLKIGVEGSVDLNVEGRYLYRPSLVGTMSEPQSGGKTYDLGKLNSHSAHAKGELAIKGTAKFLWIEATATIKKWTFLDKDLFTAGAYDLIEQWAEDNGVAIAGVQPTANGIDVFTVQPAVMRTQSRDYLQSAATPSSVLPRLAAPGSSLLGETQYPYADPQTTRDGQIVAYLSDQGSPDVNDTRVYYTAAGSTGTEAHVLSDPATDRINNPSGDALPDSDLAMDGTEQFQAASWVRSRAPIGGEVTDASALEMLNNTEVYAAVHTGGAGSASHGNWVTTRLTDNDTADVGPQVAALGNRAVVAWSAPQGTGLNVENAADPNS
ncbi:MAG: hypothetical protein LBJ08_12680, partial [Bifidobacteriaceae bacterium]|nr:hypothetical protein [Bifidobacteriaceae bacterium]